MSITQSDSKKNPLNLNQKFTSSSEGVILTRNQPNMPNQGSVSMKNQDLMFNQNDVNGNSNTNLQSKISKNFQSKMQDKGFLDFEDLL
jgi:hypothetical protein